MVTPATLAAQPSVGAYAILIASNESDLLAYTREHDKGSKDKPGREFSVARRGSSAASVGSVSVRHDGVEGAAAPPANMSGASESGRQDLSA